MHRLAPCAIRRAMKNKKRLLICDDEKSVHESLGLILGETYALDYAFSGDEAVEKLKNVSFDGILLDIKMPEKDGLETLDDIKALSPDVKIIIVTGYNTVETAQKAIKLGALDYITKPFDEKEVKEKVSRV